VLDAELRAVLPDLGEIRNLRRLTGGASRETWAFEEGDRPLIYRRGAGVGREAGAIRAAAAAGVPEPEVIAFGEDWAVMERVDGETIARRILRDERFAAVRPKLAEQCGEILARIHTIPADAVPGLESYDVLADLEGIVHAFEDPSPALELGLRWLTRNRPAADREMVLHGDFRNGNLVVGEDGIRAVLDWELVHRGDPMQDLGYLCVRAWRFGGPAPVGGFGSYEDLFAGYERVSGADVDREAVRWWEMFGTVWWGGACMLQAWRHLSGGERSVELAAIGRRVWEQEYDVLLALA
jgi:aminoglycoside phosphotransferase (APT) family kinase protein